MAVNLTVPGCSLARIQMAPVPPISANGLSPMISAGPSSSKLDGVVGEWPDGAEFIGDAQDHASGVGSIGIQLQSSGQQGEFLDRCPCRRGFSRSPACPGCSRRCADRPTLPMTFVEVGDEGRITEVRELGFGRGRLPRPAYRRYVELEVIAVGADHGLGESDGLIAARPVKCRLEHDLFRRDRIAICRNPRRAWARGKYR